MNKDLKGAFASAKPLEEALEPEDIEEFTQEDMEQISFGMSLNYNENFNGKRFYKGEITKPFLTHYLFECTSKEIRLIEIDKFSEVKKKLIRKKLTEIQDDVVEGEVEHLDDSVETLEEVEIEEIKDPIVLKELNEEIEEQKSKKQLIDTLKTRTKERDFYLKAFKELVNIFIEQNIKADISKESVKLIKEVI